MNLLTLTTSKPICVLAASRQFKSRFNGNPAMRTLFSCLLVLVLFTRSFEMTGRSDEGMWLLDEPPRELLKAKYGFDLSNDWLEHARLSSIRFNNGGSGSFVSSDGLMITNHHVGSD